MVDLSTGSLVLAWHGTRHPDGEGVAERVADRVARGLPGVDVRVGWVDLHPRTLPLVLAEAGDATLVPCFLSAGYHVRHDVPEAVAASGHRVAVTTHLGGALTGAVADRIAEAGGPGDGVVLAAAGSLHADALAEVEAVADELAGRLGVRVVAAYVYSARPGVAEAVASLRAAGAEDLLIAPYALAPGLWADRVAGLGTRIAQPLGDHPAVASAIAARYLSAATGSSGTLDR